MAGRVAQPKAVRWDPHPYQRKAVKFLLERGAGALFLDPGLGKTSITAAVLKVLKSQNAMRGALVIAPLRVARMVWPSEFTKWSDFHGMSVGVLHGDNKQNVLEEDHDVYVTNHDTIPWLFGRDKPIDPKTGKPSKTWRKYLTPAGKLLMSKVNILVMDELSKFKHTDTQRFKRIEPWLGKFDRRYGLTGSPASNGLLDLFGQCYVLDGGRSLGRFITHYREQYFVSVDRMGYTYRPKLGAQEAIVERLKPLVLSMSAEDHMTLPTVRNYPIKLDLPAEVRVLYEDMEDNLLTALDREIFTAPNVASAQMSCRQMCSGAMYKSQRDVITNIKKSGPREWVHLHDVKLDAMEELIEELQGSPLLVGYEFQHDLERILKRWPNLPHFGKSEKEDERIEKEWNAGLLPVVLGHPQSIGHGLNLQGANAHNVLWFTLTWNYELYNQFIRRLRRQGNDSAYLNVYSLVMRNTVDESVAYALKGKKCTEDDLIRALKTRKRLD